MMKILLPTLFLLSAASAKKCTGVHFNDRYYTTKVLKEGLNNIQQMILNRNDNTLYFIFDQIAVVPTRVAGYLNLDTSQAGVIDGVRNASSVAIDQPSNIVYIGGADGIYKVNSINSRGKVAESLPVRDDIRNMFYKDVLFFTNARKEAFMYQNGYINPVFELQGVKAEKIILDDDYNIFFSQGKTLFRVKLGTRIVNTHEKYLTDVLATDADFRPYVCTKDNIFVYNKYKYVMDKVADVKGVKALTFTKADEPVYAVYDWIIQLQLSPIACYEN